MLPRWHQDDRGWRNRSRGFHQLAPDGAYAHVRAWSGRRHWLTFVVPTAIALRRQLFTLEELSPTTFRRWALIESGYAHQRTGRRCIVRPATVASAMGCTPNTVRKCRRVARQLGLQVVIVLGRMLTADECWAARHRGSRQRGLSTECALTVPKACSQTLAENNSVTPTRGIALPLKPHRHSSPLGGPHGASAEQKEAAPPPLRPARRLRTSSGRTNRRPGQHNRPSTRHQGAQLAQDLGRRLPWLATEQPGRLIPTLTRFAAATPAWTADDLADAIATLRLQRGLTTPLTADTIKTRPAVVLAAFLRQLHHDDDHPRLALVEPDELRCHRPECDHGWTTLPSPTPTAVAHHGLYPHDDNPTTVTRCDHCRPGAWPAPTPDDLLEVGYYPDDTEEPPF